MSQIVRQSNLFAGEDFTKIYKSFQDIDFTAYDFDTIKLALVDYIKVQYPEDFNDYIESSEFVAIIELLAYLGTSLAFRVDLNSRENIMDTAQRRESIVRLARLINYQPKRNLAANGLFKVASLRTDQPIVDSIGNSIANIPVFWADPNNPDWFDQFVSVLNNSLNPTNPFGRPSKSGEVGGIPTDLYELNNVLGLNVTQPVSITVNGEQIPIDITNASFTDGETFYEKDPNPDDPFGLIYRNDSLGVASDNTGFFLYFKQGRLNKADYRYDYPVPNRVQELPFNNINQTDVYVQEIDDTGVVQEQWERVPSVSGSNVIFNSINFNERNIFEAISELNDQVSVKFADGNFGNTPTGIYRYWYRTSIGRTIVIRPEDAQELQFTMPYTGADGQTYNLVIAFELQNAVSNGAPAETNEQIKLRAPQTFYTQDRMVNNEDYNVFPLIQGNEIAKLRAINRTYAGHSRYISINDPTGFYTNLTLIGEDGALYNDSEEQRALIPITQNVVGNVTDEVLLQISEFANNNYLQNFYDNNYITTYEWNFGGFGTNSPFALPYETFWKTAPDKSRNDTGYYILSTDRSDLDWPLGSPPTYSNVIEVGLTGSPYQYLRTGATVTYDSVEGDPSNKISVLLQSVVNNGKPVNPAIITTGSNEISSEVIDLRRVSRSVPGFNTTVSTAIVLQINDRLNARQDFGLGYDVKNDEWYIIDTPDVTAVFDLTPLSGNPNEIDRTNPASWLITVDYQAGDGQTLPAFEVISRGTVTIFESLKQVRFYWDPDSTVFDATTGRALRDTIELIPRVNFDSEYNAPLLEALSWTLDGVFIHDDGYQDPTKIEIIPADLDENGVPDHPGSFRTMVDPLSEVVFERYINLDGYELTRPWICAWTTDFPDLVTVQANEITLYGLDIPNVPLDEMGFRTTVGTVVTSIPLGDYDLFMFNADPGTIQVDGVVVPATIERIAELLESSVGWNGSNLLTVRENARRFIAALATRTLRAGLASSSTFVNAYWNILISDDPAGNPLIVSPILDPLHFGLNGTSFEQNTSALSSSVYEKDLIYKWNHFAPGTQRIDPSVSNIIDTVVLTYQYYNDVIIWKDERGAAVDFPPAPTTEDLRVQFSDLNKYKSISDELIFNSGKFKILFGAQAEPELRAVFKAVKIPTANISDNELKTRIIQSIDEYFNINNWDFGERFFFTELAAYIHTQLSKFLNSVVIVPTKEEAEFGNLFEIVSNPDQLFLSTATVDDVKIVKNYTETNLRV